MSELTIIMPVYNGMPYLPEAVESIRRQTIENWRFLIVDDGSTDETCEYLDSLSDSRIEVVRQENQGPAAAANLALERCETPLLARMDADDVAHSERFERQLAFLRANPTVGLVGTQIEPLGSKRVGRGSKLPIAHDPIYHALIHGRHAMCNPTIMCRTQLLRDVGGYVQDGALEDWAMFLRVGQVSKLANLDQVLLSYRIHASSCNGRHMGELRSRISFACDRARREESDAKIISYQEFLTLHRQRPIWKRAIDACQSQAMVQYRKSQCETLGEHRVRGCVRLALAASLSPHMTWHRVTRGIRKRLSQSKSRDASARAPHEPDSSCTIPIS